MLTGWLHTAGSGKSSLLAAMLGLMQQVAGTPDALRGKVAYVPQVSCYSEGHTYSSPVIMRGSPKRQRTSHITCLSCACQPVDGFEPPVYSRHTLLRRFLHHKISAS